MNNTILDLYMHRGNDGIVRGSAVYRTETGRRFSFNFFVVDFVVDDPFFGLLDFLNKLAEKKRIDLEAKEKEKQLDPLLDLSS